MCILTATPDVFEIATTPQREEIWPGGMDMGVTQTSGLNLEAIVTDVTWSKGRHYNLLDSHS